MKKSIITIAVAVLTLGIGLTTIIMLASNKKAPAQDESSNTTTEEEPTKMEENKTLVLYFSATGTTAKVANVIANETAADIIAIEPKEKYTEADLNYNSDCRANREQNDDSARPEIANEINIAPYKRIYLGYPIWWGTNPKIILTLLDKYDFTNKEIALFSTSGSTDITKSVSDLKAYQQSLNIIGSKRFSAAASTSEIEGWIKSL